MSAHKENSSSSGPYLENPAVDLDTPFELRAGYDLDGEYKNARPVFQQVQTPDSEYWVLRWTEDDPWYWGSHSCEVIQHYLENGMDFIGYGDRRGYSEGNSATDAGIDVEVSAGDRSFEFREWEIPNILGAFEFGYTLEDWLEDRNPRVGSNEVDSFAISDYRKKRYLSGELDEDKDEIYLGLAGFTPFREEDSEVSPYFENEDLSRLRSLTSDMAGNFNE